MPLLSSLDDILAQARMADLVRNSTANLDATLKAFYSLREAQIVIEQWRIEYNTHRPHSALGKRGGGDRCPTGLARCVSKSSYSMGLASG